MPAIEQQVDRRAEGPYIGLEPMPETFTHLGRHVWYSAYDTTWSLATIDGTAKIGELDNPVRVKKKVRRLDISMDAVLGMTMLQSKQHLREYARKKLTFLKVCVHHSEQRTFTLFHNKRRKLLGEKCVD